MTILTDVLSELFSMFVADARLTAAILGLVAIVGGLIGYGNLAPLIGGVVLLVGCLSILVGAVILAAREKR